MSNQETPNDPEPRITHAPLLPFVLSHRDIPDAVPDSERPVEILLAGEERPQQSWTRIGIKIVPSLIPIILGIIMKNPQKIVSAFIGAIAILVLELWDFQIPEFLLRLLDTSIVGLVMWLQTSPFDRKK